MKQDYLMNKINHQTPQLFMFHFAGGSGYSYLFLNKYLSLTFEIVSVELPGRGRRINEDLITSIDLAVKDQINEVLKKRRNNLPFLIYGHSMGAVLAFEVVKLLKQIKDTPFCLIVTGNAKVISAEKKHLYKLPELEFIKELKAMGGTSNEIFEDVELFRFFEPILRADFKLIDSYNNKDLTKVDCPILCAMGSLENHVESIHNWKDFTESSFTSKIFPGNHFFIHEHSEALADFIIQAYHEYCIF